MKSKKMFILMLAVMLFVSSLTLTVHADVDSYTFGGSCKRFFTTTKYLEQSDKNWLPVVNVICTELEFDSSPSYNYGCVVLVSGNGVVDSLVKAVRKGGSVILPIDEDYDFKTMKVRLIHPYYNENKETATSSMHIAGSVEKDDIC